MRKGQLPALSRNGCFGPGTQILRCQYVYFCTSKASPLRQVPGSALLLLEELRARVDNLLDAALIGP